MKQAKIFRKVLNNIYSFKLVDYPETKNYSELIKEEKLKGYRQVIINSEIMIKIITNAMQKKDIILKSITLNDAVDQYFREEIDMKVKQCRDNPLVLSELLTNLAWTSEDGSIDIEKVAFAYLTNDQFHYITVICNGVLSVTEIDYFYNNYLEAVLKRSF